MPRALGFSIGLAATLAAVVPVAAATPGGGTIFIDARTPDGEQAAPPQAFLNAASTALGDKGFVILDDPGHAAYVAVLVVSRTDVGTARQKVAAGAPLATPGALRGAGAGVVIPLSAGKTRLVPLQRTEMALSIRRRGEQAVLWRGAAVTVRSAGSRDGADERVAPALSQAAIAPYPNQSAEPVGVP